MKVIKHDGREEAFNKDKIAIAVNKACEAVGHKAIGKKIADTVEKAMEDVKKKATKGGNIFDVDTVHNLVEKHFMLSDQQAAKAYILYRQKRTDVREKGSQLNKEIARIYQEMDHNNANTGNCAASKMYGIAEACTKRYNLANMNPVFARNHKIGRIYIHDLGYRSLTINCFFNPLREMLENGFDNGVGWLRSPRRFSTAVQLACIILQSAQNDFFGGQGFLHFDTDMGKYAAVEYDRQMKDIKELLNRTEQSFISDVEIAKLAMERTEEAVYQGMEAFVANMNTMRSRSGAQVPFSSVNFGTDTNFWAKMVSEKLLRAYIAGLGHGENPIFPNLCFRLRKGINLYEDDPNYDLTKLAVECVGKRIQPRFVFCDSPAYPDKWNAGAMGCRTSVRNDIYASTNPDGKGNLAFNTINLPMLALEGNFWDNFNEALDDAINELLERYKVMCNLKVKDLPFASQWYVGGKKLNPDDSIEPMIKHGSLSVGFVGLAECLTAMIGEHHGQSDKAQSLGLKIIQTIRQKTDEATRLYKLNIGCFASPAESACYTLLKKTRDRFGIVKGVTDKEYFTNSFHLPVSFDCDAKTKIDKEAPYHLLCNAGAIMYVEANSTPKYNPQGVIEILRYMAQSGAVYGGINWEHDYCIDCGYQGTFDGVCPECGSENIKVTKVITGYLSETWRFNKGKQAEAADRTSHTGGSL